MEFTTFLPPLAGALFIAFAVARIAIASAARKNSWLLPASLSFGYFLFTLSSVVVEGPFAFWAEHTRNLWGNQIWLDLLLSAAIAWCFLVPRAKATGMRLLPSLAFVIGTGSIGLLAMTARLLFIESRSRPLSS